MTSLANISPTERRKSPGKTDGARRSLDPQTGRQVVKIFSGDWYVSTEPNEMLATILGSCVSACIRDPLLGIGGMNHFLLPGDDVIISHQSQAARYGVFAMESLINGLLKAGASKSRLEVKVFGGGNVTSNSARIGSKNAAFIRHFLRQEGFQVTTEDLEGTLPRRVHYFPDTGKVLMRRLRRKEDLAVAEEENRYSRHIIQQPIEGEIDLF